MLDYNCLGFVGGLLAARFRPGCQFCKFSFCSWDCNVFIVLDVVPATLRKIRVFICNAGFKDENVFVFVLYVFFGKILQMFLNIIYLMLFVT